MWQLYFLRRPLHHIMEEAHTHRGVLDMLNKTVQSLSEKNMNTEVQYIGCATLLDSL